MMFSIESYPRNKVKFVRLVDFFIEVLDICEAVNVDPVLDGSLAVFLYTEDSNLVLNDIDLAQPEEDLFCLHGSERKGPPK